MKRMLIATAAYIVVAHGAYAQDCKPAHDFKTVSPGVITHASVTYMPYSGISPSGEADGVDGDLLKEIAKRECLTVKTIPVDSAAALNYVISGRADVTTGGYYRTAAREKVVGLTDPLYVDQMGIVSKEGLSSFSALEGKTVGIIQGDLWVADLKKVFGPQLKTYPALSQIIQDVDAKRLDVLITGYSVAVTAQQHGQLKGMQIKVADKDERVGASVNAGQGTFPISKRNEEMMKAFNDQIKSMHEDGTIAATLKRYGLDPSAAETGAPRLLK